MSWVAAATGIASTAGSIFSGQQNAKAGEKANKLSAALTREQIAENARQFDVTQDTRGLDVERASELSGSRRAREDEINQQLQNRFSNLRSENLGALSPYANAGTSATNEQQALLGLGGADAQAAAMQRMNESPAQQFLRDRQERALLRNSAAIGGLGGGNVRTALQEQAFGLAQTDLNNRMQNLNSLAGRGISAAQGGIQSGYGPGYVQTGADQGVATQTASRPDVPVAETPLSSREKTAQIMQGLIGNNPITRMNRR